MGCCNCKKKKDNKLLNEENDIENENEYLNQESEQSNELIMQKRMEYFQSEKFKQKQIFK